MYRPGDTINERLLLRQSPDAAPVVRVFRNGVRTDTVTLTGVATSYLVSYLIPSAWATTDYVQIVAYAMFGGQTESTEVFAGRIGLEEILDVETTIVAALVCDQVPDATPNVGAFLDGVASVATYSISAGAVAGEYVVATVVTALTTGDHLRLFAYPIFDGVTDPVEMWTLPLSSGEDTDIGVLAGEWRCAPAAEPQGGDRLNKNASDSRRYAFNFGDIEEIIAGQTIASATVSATGGVTDTDTAIGTYRVAFTIGGGTAGTESVVTIAVTFSGGGSMTRTGTLVIT